jgi:hypothetical protein
MPAAISVTGSASPAAAVPLAIMAAQQKRAPKALKRRT